MTSLLTAHSVCIDSPIGRPLLRDLTLSIAEGERVAIVGRNGTGKTTLLRALAGATTPTSGRITCSGTRWLVSQLQGGVDSPHDTFADDTFANASTHGAFTHEAPPLETSTGSPGERRRLALEQAFDAAPSFLLLDEPSVDLDASGVSWLTGALRRHRGACLLVSHDRRLLRLFRDFFVVTESGCYHHHGDFDSLLESMNAKQEYHGQRYVQQLADQVHREADHVRIARRRERKKNVGRVRELKRCPSRMLLNSKRGYAQVSQAKRGALQEARIDAARDWVKSVRRALDVDLPLAMTWGAAATALESPIIAARQVALPHSSKSPRALDVDILHERWAITGPNGSGKSTLLRTLLGEQPTQPAATRVDRGRIGYIAQNASNWLEPRSLLEVLCVETSDLPRAAAAVNAHRFPLALAERPLASLSPGERVRAALIALATREPRVELLVLDEPTNHLDLLATTQLEHVLGAWPGGLLVVSHDHEFLAKIGTQHVIEL